MENGSKADVSDWVKGGTAAVCSKAHSVNEEAGVAAVATIAVRMKLHGRRPPNLDLPPNIYASHNLHSLAHTLAQQQHGGSCGEMVLWSKL